MPSAPTPASVRHWLAAPQPDPRLAHALPAGRPYEISPALGAFLARCTLETGATRVLEFGAGASSRVFAAAISLQGGGRLTSVEESPHWCRDALAQASREAGVDARLLVSPLAARLSPQGPQFVYADALAGIAARGPYDLLLIDAPQGCYGRDGSLSSILAHLAPGALVILDDAGRWKERLTLDRWLRNYPGLETLAHDRAFGGKGIAVLRFTGNSAARFSLPALVSGTLLAAVNAGARRRHRDQLAPAA